MKYTRLGNTGLTVSRICLGCMSFGSPKWSAWIKEEKESIEIIKSAYNAGINFFDTANIYSNGESEVVLGKALKEIGAPRSRIVIATKFYGAVYDENEIGGTEDLRNLRGSPSMVNRWGNSRKYIMDAVEGSLKRLGVDYIDLYQMHRLDGETPLEEVMEALNDLVRSGKVRYIGASLMKAWQFQKMNNIAEKRGWAKFISMQNCYNLMYREDERELIPYCLDAGIGGMIYSPLAGGDLTGRNRKTTREELKFTTNGLNPYLKNDSNELILDRVSELAEKHNVSWAKVSLAWALSKPYVSSVIVGIGSDKHLDDAAGSLDLELSEEEIKYLEEPYAPKPVLLSSF